MKLLKIRSVISAFILILALSVTYADPGSKETVNLQLRWFHQFQFAGFYAAEELGYYEKAGLDVNIIEGGIDTDVMKEVVSGRAEYGVQTPSILVDRADGNPVVVLAAIFQHSPIALIVNKDSGIENPSQLVGKTIMLGEKNVEIRAMLSSEGILDKITIVNFTGNYNDLINNKVDGASGYVTDVSYIENQEVNTFSYIKPITYGIDFYGDCLFTSENEIKENQERALAFRQASLEGWKYAMENPEEVIGLIVEKYKSKASKERLFYEYEQMKKLMHPDLVEVGHLNPGRWKHITETFQKLGVIRQNYDLKGFIYTDYIKKDFSFTKAALSAIAVLLFIALLIVWNNYNKAKKKEIAEEESHKRELEKNILKYSRLVENISDGIGIVDENEVFLFANKSAEKIFEVEEGCLENRSLRDFVFEENHEKIISETSKRKKGESSRYELDIVTGQGNKKTIFVNANPEYDNDGNFVSTHGVFYDVTERKKIENMLKIFKESVESSINGIGMSTPEGKHFYQNTALTELLGEVGENPLDVYVDKNIGINMFETIKSGLKWSGEVEMYSHDGKILNVMLRAYPVKDNEGNITALVGIHTDITERKKKEQEIAELKSRFEYVLGATNTGFDIIDEENNVIYVDPNWSKILGDYQGRKCYEYFMGGSRPCHDCKIQEAIRKGISVISEEFLEKENRFIEVHTIPLNETFNGKRLVSEFNIDITGRKIIEKRLREFNNELETKVAERTIQLEEANKELESFSYSVSHDLRAPIRHISGFSKILFGNIQVSDKEKANENLKRISEAVFKMENLIDSLIEFSRTSRKEISKLPTSLNKIVHQIVDEYKICHRKNELEWRVSGLPDVMCDTNLIKIVWENLIDNAYKYTGNKKTAIIEIGYSESMTEYEFYIKDNGIGFDMEFSHKLFGVFQRLHLEKDFPGTGIGLATVKRIITRHGGRAWAKGEVDKGAAFYFTLPKTTEAV